MLLRSCQFSVAECRLLLKPQHAWITVQYSGFSQICPIQAHSYSTWWWGPLIHGKSSLSGWCLAACKDRDSQRLHILPLLIIDIVSNINSWSVTCLDNHFTCYSTTAGYVLWFFAVEIAVEICCVSWGVLSCSQTQYGATAPCHRWGLKVCLKLVHD